MDPHARLKDPYYFLMAIKDFGDEPIYMSDEYRHEYLYKDRYRHDCDGSKAYLLRYMLEAMAECEDHRQTQRARQAADKRDPLLKRPHSAPRCRAHLLMVDMPGGQRRRAKGCRKKLDLLMEAV